MEGVGEGYIIVGQMRIVGMLVGVWRTHRWAAVHQKGRASGARRDVRWTLA